MSDSPMESMFTPTDYTHSELPPISADSTSLFSDCGASTRPYNPLHTGDVIVCETAVPDENGTVTVTERLLILCFDDHLQTLIGWDLDRQEYVPRQYVEVAKQFDVYDAELHEDPFEEFPSRSPK